MKHVLASSILALSLAITAAPAKAGGIPVIDTASIAQAVATIQQLQRTYGVESQQLSTGLRQLTEAVKTVERLQQQIDQLDRQFDAITGTRGMGALLNGNAIKATRRMAGRIGEINATLHDLTNGLPDGNPLKAKIAALKGKFAIPEAADIFDAARVPAKVAAHDLASESTVTTLVLAEDGFSRANASLTRVEGLLEAVDTAPDLKAAIDLNTRMVAELAFMLADSQRLEAARAQMEGALANETLRDREAGKRRLTWRSATGTRRRRLPRTAALSPPRIIPPRPKIRSGERTRHSWRHSAKSPARCSMISI